MKFIIGNDIHVGSKHATHTESEVWAEINNALNKNATIVLNGDIWDLANVPKKEVASWIKRARDFVAVCKSLKLTFIRGNHCLNQVESPDFAIIDNVYFSHGDYEFWGKEKADKYRSKKPGAGFLKRWFTPVYDNLRHFAKGGPNENFFKAMDKIIEEHNPRAAVFGHRHPKENIIFDYKGVRCYILKRGIQEIEI